MQKFSRVILHNRGDSSGVLFETYIVSGADSHAGMPRCNLLYRAQSGQMIICSAAGILTRERWEFLQRQVLIQQTTVHGNTQKNDITLHFN